MSKFMPAKPKFGAALMRTLGGGDEKLVNCILENQFNAWWDKEIAPLFQNSVDAKHKALFLSIQSIPKVTPDDIIHEFTKRFDKSPPTDLDVKKLVEK